MGAGAVYTPTVVRFPEDVTLRAACGFALESYHASAKPQAALEVQ